MSFTVNFYILQSTGSGTGAQEAVSESTVYPKTSNEAVNSVGAKVGAVLSSTHSDLVGRLSLVITRVSDNYVYPVINVTASDLHAGSNVDLMTDSFPVGSYRFYINYDLNSCEDNSDCDQGEKCVDGECVPCEKIVNGHGTLTLYATHKTDGTFLSDAYQREWVGSNSYEFYLPNASPYAGLFVLPNGIQANLKISVFYGFLGASSWSKVAFEGAVNQQVVEFNYPPESDLPFGCSYSSKVLVEVTNYVSLGDCADILTEPEDPVIPDPPIIEEPETPVDPEEEDPIEKEEHEGEGEKPDKPEKPEEPQNCDCENYIAKSVQVGSDQIFDMIGSVKDAIDRLSNNLTKDLDRVALSINQAANLNNVALAAINTNLYNLLMFLSDKMYKEFVEYRADFKTFGFFDNKWMSEILHRALIHPSIGELPSVGSVEYFKKISEDLELFKEKFQEFSDSYEPVQIENEYRVQSHRIIDDIDSTVSKL